jgi:hypothetical protein
VAEHLALSVDVLVLEPGRVYQLQPCIDSYQRAADGLVMLQGLIDRYNHDTSTDPAEDV